ANDVGPAWTNYAWEPVGEASV
ncbi:MAG: hypothetical protein QOG79_3712, partial [Mycobacterium sp.]|nr:hypothetical protein [Mycobacterium sp.]